MTEPTAQRPEVCELPPDFLEGLRNATKALRFIRHALVGVSIEFVDDSAAADVRDLANVVNQVVTQLRELEALATPKHGEQVH